MATTKELDVLKRDLVVMAEKVEHSLATAVMALVDRDSDLALYVIDYDEEVDEADLELGRQCMDLMAGKLADKELRLVFAASRISNDLERVGDLAVSVSEHVLFLVRERSVLTRVIDFGALLDQVSQMMREAVSALLEGDPTLAWKIIDEREIVEEERQVIFRAILEVMRGEPRSLERCCHLHAILDNLRMVAERAGDIAEEVIFTTEGKVVRHHLREYHPVTPSLFGDLSTEEDERLESAILDQAKTREQIRREHESDKSTRRKRTSPEEVAEAASSARERAADATKKMLNR